ncbi:hypothetical protein LDENG_00118420 [Lucifuga dentata]|nr:hypothetical protein LDENG_00118420 [Lucifuga dentata]
MEEARRIDLTYITERIITISCPSVCPEETYLQNLCEIILMLQSKHGHDYMFINLSEKNDTVTQMSLNILDTGWVDLLAPNLDQIFSICTLMENWLQKHPKHVLVLHCRGGKGRIGVLVASYIHLNNISASADISLDHFAMRRFYSDKLSPAMTPSQKRYAWMLGSMLKGRLSLCPSPTFLLCIVLLGLPKIRPDGGCCLFLKVYQSLQAVCTSAVYHVHAGQTDRLYFVLQPAQLLKGDVMVVCYDRNSQSGSRQVIFRLQFPTGIVHGHTLTFSKADLDCASEDPRFPEDGKVQLLLSDSPEKITGRELWQNGLSVTVDYDTLEPLVRRDSFSDSLQTELPRVLSHGNDNLHTKVKKRSSEEGALFSPTTSSPTFSDRAPSASSDSGLSITSQGRAAASAQKPGRDHGTQARKQVSGAELGLAQPPLEVMTDLPASSGGEAEMAGDDSGSGHVINGEILFSERETDILDDEDEVDNDASVPVLEMPNSSSICLSSENLPEAQESTQSEYNTHSWVQQQQMVDVRPEDGEERKAPPLIAPDTPPRGISSRDAVQRGLTTDDATHNTHNTHATHSSSLPCQDEELESLATDIDESIEQLNQLILDLDPTFIPVPTCCAPLSRSASLDTNGLSHKENTHLSGWRQQRQVSDVTDYPCLSSPGWKGGGAQSFRTYSPTISSSQHGHLYKSSSVDYRGQTPLMDGANVVPPTPAFPISPPTPYVKSFSEFSHLRGGNQWDQHSWTQGNTLFPKRQKLEK